MIQLWSGILGGWGRRAKRSGCAARAVSRVTWRELSIVRAGGPEVDRCRLWIGTEHVVLGLLAEPSGGGGDVLRRLGMTTQIAEDAVRRRPASGSRPGHP